MNIEILQFLGNLFLQFVSLFIVVRTGMMAIDKMSDDFQLNVRSVFLCIGFLMWWYVK